jgi:hypothetical protein
LEADVAKMIPAVEDLSQIEHSSEISVYAALRAQLSDEFTVLHSYPWLRPWRGEGALMEGEADFVIIHQELGVLVLEVKGGEVIYEESRGWSRRSGDELKPFQDPFNQARRNMHALLSLIDERAGGRVKKQHLTYGYAVVFPHCHYRGTPPANAERALIISHPDMASLEEAVKRAYTAWTDQPLPLARDQLQVVRECLMPKFRVFRPVGVDISEVSERLLELTEAQAAVFEGLYAQRRVLVKGVAGSGKTLIALQRALAFARARVKTLFLCYNRELAAWLRRLVEADHGATEHRELLKVANFHSLARELAQEAGVDFLPEAGGELDQKFWDEEVPDIMEQALLALNTTFDALVVDEAQDFSLGWWYALTQSILSTEQAPIYAFMDPNQSLRGEVEEPDLEFQTTFELKINCRNTRKIAAASTALLEIEAEIWKLTPEGAAVRLIRCPTPSAQKGLVLSEVKRLLEQEQVRPEQLALIGPKSLAKGSLAGIEEVAGAPVTHSAEVWRGGGHVLVTTAKSFKGLESEVVLLYDLENLGGLFLKQDLYVACTRAKVMLIAVAMVGSECLTALLQVTQNTKGA